MGRPNRISAKTWAKKVGGIDNAAVTMTFGPFEVGTDPYFVRVERVATADKEFQIAFGGYTVLFHR